MPEEKITKLGSPAGISLPTDHFDKNGDPREDVFAAALEMWVYCQPGGKSTVSEAAKSFGATPAVIRSLVDSEKYPYLMIFDD